MSVCIRTETSNQPTTIVAVALMDPGHFPVPDAQVHVAVQPDIRVVVVAALRDDFEAGSREAVITLDCPPDHARGALDAVFFTV